MDVEKAVTQSFKAKTWGCYGLLWLRSGWIYFNGWTEEETNKEVKIKVNTYLKIEKTNN